MPVGVQALFRDGARVPDQRALRMRDQKPRYRHLQRCKFFLLESVPCRIGVVKNAAIKYLEPERLRRTEPCEGEPEIGRPAAPFKGYVAVIDLAEGMDVRVCPQRSRG